MNKGFILKALFLLCFLFSQTAQGQSFTPGEIWPDNHKGTYQCAWRRHFI